MEKSARMLTCCLLPTKLLSLFPVSTSPRSSSHPRTSVSYPKLWEPCAGLTFQRNNDLRNQRQK